MASQPQQSKRDRGRAHVGLPPKQQAPKYGRCPACGDPIHNQGAHAEACRGDRVFTGEYQCGRCLGVYKQGRQCCGVRTYPIFRRGQNNDAAF